MTIYGAGLRAEEASKLKIRHIEKERMGIRVDQGKGNKDRYTILPVTLLNQLNEYCRYYHPTPRCDNSVL